MRRRARQYCNKEESGRKKEEELLELAHMHVYARIKYEIRVQVVPFLRGTCKLLTLRHIIAQQQSVRIVGTIIRVDITYFSRRC